MRLTLEALGFFFQLSDFGLCLIQLLIAIHTDPLGIFSQLSDLGLCFLASNLNFKISAFERSVRFFIKIP